MIKVIFLDIDNTLFSFSGYVKQTMKEGFAHFNLKPYEDYMYPIFERINNGLWRQIEEGTLTFDELQKIRWNKIFKELEIEYDGVVFEEYFRKQLFYSAIPEPGAIDLVKYLNKKYTLCVASNGPHEQQINRLRIGKLYDYITYFFTSERLGVQKPSSEFFEACFEELRNDKFPDLLPGEVMIIGDSVTADIAGGKQMGIHTCLYTCGKKYPNGVQEADYIVDSLNAIKEIL